MLRHAYTGSPPPRSADQPPGHRPVRRHKTKDGQVILGLQNEREWGTFCQKVSVIPPSRPIHASSPWRSDGRTEKSHGGDRRFLQ